MLVPFACRRASRNLLTHLKNSQSTYFFIIRISLSHTMCVEVGAVDQLCPISNHSVPRPLLHSFLWTRFHFHADGVEFTKHTNSFHYHYFYFIFFFFCSCRNFYWELISFGPEKLDIMASIVIENGILYRVALSHWLFPLLPSFFLAVFTLVSDFYWLNLNDWLLVVFLALTLNGFYVTNHRPTINTACFCFWIGVG